MRCGLPASVLWCLSEIGIAMASAAAVQVHSNSSRSCFSSSVLAWTTQTMASSAYCRNV